MSRVRAPDGLAGFCTQPKGRATAIHLGRRHRAPRDPDDCAETRFAGVLSDKPARRPYLVLLPVGFTVPSPLPATLRCPAACRRPGRPGRRSPLCGTVPGSPPPGITRHRVSVEPGLSSPAAGKRRRRPSDRLAVLMLGATTVVASRPRLLGLPTADACASEIWPYPSSPVRLDGPRPTGRARRRRSAFHKR